MAPYFPGSYPKGRQCDRDYLFNVANTLHPGIMQEYIDHALKMRYDPKMGDNNKPATSLCLGGGNAIRFLD